MSSQRLTFLERLATFEGYWDDAVATARQLAALGHVFDRPPLAFLEEGSCCIACGFFVSKPTSVLALEGGLRSKDFVAQKPFNFHHSGCERLPIRMPYDANRWDSTCDETCEPGVLQRRKYCRALDPVRRHRADLHLGRGKDDQDHQCHLLALPVELRLQIYNYLLPLRPSQIRIRAVRGGSLGIHVQSRVWNDKERFSARKRSIDLDDRTWQWKTGVLKESLLQSCSQIHDEVLELFYRKTVIRAEESRTMYLFLRQIGSRGRRALRYMTVGCGQREDAIAYALLGTCSRLERICLMPKREIKVARGPLWMTEGVASIMALEGVNVHVEDETKFRLPILATTGP